jgi:serine/threonine protein phosphatase 1
MFASLRNLFRGTTSAGPAVSAAVQRAKLDRPLPGVDTYVVGDVHGRADLLERVLEAIDADIGQIRARNPQLVFVGDYIDRGPDSAAVLRRMLELSTELPNNVTCLLGNHERMMLDFLVDPVSRGPRWLRSGGTSTLESFGLHTGALAKNPSFDLEQRQSLGGSRRSRSATCDGRPITAHLAVGTSRVSISPTQR